MVIREDIVMMLMSVLLQMLMIVNQPPNMKMINMIMNVAWETAFIYANKTLKD